MKLALVAIGVLLGTTLMGCAQPAQSPSDQVSTTQLTSADAPLPPAQRKPLLGWYENDPAPPPKPKALDSSDPWSGEQPATRAAESPAAQDPNKPAEKAATPAVQSPSER